MFIPKGLRNMKNINTHRNIEIHQTYLIHKNMRASACNSHIHTTRVTLLKLGLSFRGPSQLWFYDDVIKNDSTGI